MSIVAEKQQLQQKKFDLSKNTYLDREKDLSGYVLFHDLSGAFSNGWIYCEGQITNSITSADFLDLPIQLKSANVYLIYQWIETCSTYTTIGMVGGEIVSTYSETHCSTSLVYGGTFTIGSGTSPRSTGGGTPGGYIPTNQGCNCPQLCPVCNNCIDLLKSAPLPGTSTTTTILSNCVYCTGHPEPVPTPTEVFFDDIKMINMESPTLLQEITCLIRNLKNSGTSILTTDVIEGIGDSYNPGYEITQKEINYLGHRIKIVVVYDRLNVMNSIGKRTESQGTQVVFHEIFVKAKMNSSREQPNLIRLKFDPSDLPFLNSVWSHINGTTNLWPCNY